MSTTKLMNFPTMVRLCVFTFRGEFVSVFERALQQLTPADVLLHLAEYLGKSAPELHGSPKKGKVLDFRPGYEEEHPSLSYDMGEKGPIFYRFGRDDSGGGAVSLLQSVGIPKPEAAKLLIQWAGLEKEAQRSERKMSSKPQKPAQTKRSEPDPPSPLNSERYQECLRGFNRVEADENSPEGQEIARRGLTPAVRSGALIVHKWSSSTKSLPGQFRAGVLLFESTGPDGKPWALRGRNPGTKETCDAQGISRYATFKGMRAVPWVGRIPAETADAEMRILIVEGEFNAVACFVMLQAAGPASKVTWEVQGIASAQSTPHIKHIAAGTKVYVYADPDVAGAGARSTWHKLLSSQGAQVFQFGDQSAGQASPFCLDGCPEADACDALSKGPPGVVPDIHAASLGKKLLQALEAATPCTLPTEEAPGPVLTDQPAWCEEGDVLTSRRTGYGVRQGKLCLLTLKTDRQNGEDWLDVETLADFSAWIVSEVTLEDGTGESERVFEIEGRRPDGRSMHPEHVLVTATEFTSMSWPMEKWGAAARLHAGAAKKDKARDAIQAISLKRGVTERTVYTHTGWIKYHGHNVYLTAGTCIGKDGGVSGIEVKLPGRLSAYDLPDPTTATSERQREAVMASLDLLELVPDPVGVPVLGAMYRAILGRIDFIVWVTGETGRHKTAFLGLAQSHYGSRWNRNFLPESWLSTANAVELYSSYAKDIPLIVDDYKPSGNASERAKSDGKVSRITQAAADGVGRSTLTSERQIRPGLHPRGTVMSSAEDIPRGHSNRARLAIVEVDKPLIDSEEKSRSYYAAEDKGRAGVYALALGSYVQCVASDIDQLYVGSEHHRKRIQALAPHFRGTHGRTGHAAAEMAYGWEIFLSFAVEIKAISTHKASELWQRVGMALSETAKDQAAHLVEADPVDSALTLLADLLAQGRVYLEDRANGGPVPAAVAAMCGWQVSTVESESGTTETYVTKPGAVMVGYYSKDEGPDAGLGYFLPNGTYEVLQRARGGQGGNLLPDPSKLWANMRDRLEPRGLMKCNKETGRKTRPTLKAQIPDGSIRPIIALRLPLLQLDSERGNLGNQGKGNEESTSETTTAEFPIFSPFFFSLGNLGKEANKVAHSSVALENGEQKEEPPRQESWSLEI